MDNNFLQIKDKTFRNEVCDMVSLKNKSKSKYSELRKEILKTFNENMFKYSSYGKALGFSKKTFNSLIKEALSSENITNTACKEKQYEDEKKEIEALLLSFLYVFMNPDNVKSLGPGDIVGEEYFHLSDSLQAEVTQMFNDLTNASFDSSVFGLPGWFILPNKNVEAYYVPPKDVMPPTISYFERERFMNFWTEYNNYKEKIRFLCTKKTCTDEQDFDLYTKTGKINDESKVLQADLLSPPCHDMILAKQFNFRQSVI